MTEAVDRAFMAVFLVAGTLVVTDLAHAWLRQIMTEKGTFTQLGTFVPRPQTRTVFIAGTFMFAWLICYREINKV